MELLGLVWAASLLNQATPVAEASDTGRSSYAEEPAPLIGPAAWFTSLAQVHGWVPASHSSFEVYRRYGLIASWLTPEVETVTPLLSSQPATEAIPPVFFSEIGARFVVAQTPLPTNTDMPFKAPWETLPEVQVVSSNGLQVAADSQSEAVNPACVAESPVPYQTSPAATPVGNWQQIWVQGHYIGDVTGRAVAQRLASKLRSRLAASGWNPADIQPLFGENFAAASVSNDILFVVDEAMRPHPEVPATAVAVQWVNNLRQALDTAPLDLAQVQMAMQGLQPTPQRFYGVASWYGPGFHGRKTATGETFNQNDLTAAHKTLPFGTYLKVRNRLNNKTVIVRINDRGPYVGDRSLDLSRAAAACLESQHPGVVPYEAVVLEPAPQPTLDALLTAHLTPNMSTPVE